MILTAKFEPRDMVPPKVWEQTRQALARVLDMYGFNVTIREDRQDELDANQRYWTWVEEERSKRGG